MRGMESLRRAVDEDLAKDNFHDYESKYNWIIERAKKYAEICNTTYEEVLKLWEERRNYWYMNYYQESAQPLPEGNVKVYVFESASELVSKMKENGNKGFRCSCCGGITTNPYECNSGLKLPKGKKVCDWKTYGLFRGGVPMLFKKEMIVEYIFKPIYLEELEK